jgi:hypothetical protein
MKTNAPIKNMVRITLALGLALCAAFSTATAATATGIDGKTAFARLKSLSGDWTGPEMMGHKLNQNYRVIAGGSAVMETCFPGTKMEMVSLYYLKGDSLEMSHYCMLGNQPHMRLNTRKSSADTLVFDFAGGDNISSTNGHMHAATLHIAGRNKIEMTGTLKMKGKPDMTCNSTLVRKR